MRSKRMICGCRRASLWLLLLGAAVATGAGAAEMPKRKAGLWELHTQMEGMPGGPPIQMCVDRASDNLLQQAEEKPDCSTMDVKTHAGRTTVHAVCRMQSSTVTMDAVYIGSFESGYKGDVKMRYSPPIQGMSAAHMTQEAKWLGPCQPGQKPGDVIMPGMGEFNVNDMMKDPGLRELMKRGGKQGQ